MLPRRWPPPCAVRRGGPPSGRARRGHRPGRAGQRCVDPHGSGTHRPPNSRTRHRGAWSGRSRAGQSRPGARRRPRRCGRRALRTPCSGGTLAIEAHHVLGIVTDAQFDIVTHAHRSYLSLVALERAMARHGLTIEAARKVDLHGGSLQIEARRSGDGRVFGSTGRMRRSSNYAKWSVRKGLIASTVMARSKDVPLARFGSCARSWSYVSGGGSRLWDTALQHVGQHCSTVPK